MYQTQAIEDGRGVVGVAEGCLPAVAPRSRREAQAALPGAKLLAPSTWQKIAKHPLLFHYNRLVALALAANLAILADAHDTALAARAVSANLAIAVLVRQRHVWNLAFAVARRVPPRWPLWIRRSAAKVYHLGGLHVGAAVSAVAWFAVFTADLTAQAVRAPGGTRSALLGLSYALVLLLVAICVLALPVVRRRRHDLFERSHRFLGWLSILLFWAQSVIADGVPRGGAAAWSDLLGAPQTWVLLVVSASVVEPWLRLRRVAVSVLRPSSHVAVLRFDYGWTPFNGSTTVISRSPLTEWHAFAVVDFEHRQGYRVVVSRAGDWTADLIDDPPASVWVKGGAARGMTSVEPLFGRVVFVATGSGIGPTLTHLVGRPKDRPMTLVWVARSHREVFGDELVDEVLRLVPGARLVDTATHGKPDMVALAYHVARGFRADGVICVANKKVTWDVVYGLESRGIPACGALWDS
jgi:hypothetical protein